MSFLGWIQRLRNPQRTKHYADRLVERFTNVVRTTTRTRTAGMPRAEARGYIRAKAVAVVSEAVDALRKADAFLTKRNAEIVLTLAVERIVVAVQETTHRTQAQTPAKKAA